jgi:hypothetical protein
MCPLPCAHGFDGFARRRCVALVRIAGGDTAAAGCSILQPEPPPKPRLVSVLGRHALPTRALGMEKGLTVRTKRSSLLRLFQASGDFIPRCASLRADLRSRLI